MNIIEYQRMAERERNYWWHVGRLSIIETYLKKTAAGRKNLKILNVGCGTGGTLPLLEKYGTVDNVDVSEEAIAFMKKNGYSNVRKVDGIALPFKDNTYDIVVAFDVLEHIDEDTEALKEWKRVLKPGGHAVITVPAYQWLWTDHDTSLHHFRRHTRRSIKQRARAAEMGIVRSSYAFVFSLPLVAGFRYLNKALRRKVTEDTSYVNVPETVNNVFIWLLLAEAKAHRALRFPAGTTVISVLAKSES